MTRGGLRSTAARRTIDQNFKISVGLIKRIIINKFCLRFPNPDIGIGYQNASKVIISDIIKALWSIGLQMSSKEEDWNRVRESEGKLSG